MSARKTRPLGPRGLEAGAEAKRRMVILLETLSGVRTTQEAADALGVALARYYQLETYALEGFLAALEPRARGRQVTAEAECARLREEIARLEREVKRQQALYRTAQRALGVPKEPGRDASRKGPKGSKAGPVRRRRKTTRGERVLAALARTEAKPAGGASDETGGES